MKQKEIEALKRIWEYVQDQEELYHYQIVRILDEISYQIERLKTEIKEQEKLN